MIVAFFQRRVVWASLGSAGVVGAGLTQLAEDPNYTAAHQAEVVEHWVQTGDEAWVTLQRRESAGPPVVLVHGISSNHHFWDLGPDRSLAEHLHSQGFDVWNMDLRGHGPARFDRDGKRQKAGWTVDDYGAYDLPAAFTYVQEQTGHDELHYVGHSMGGMVLAVYLATHDDVPLASAVAVASPLDFRDADPLTGFALRNAWMTAPLSFIPSPMGAKLIANLRRSPLSIDDHLFNPANVSPTARQQMYKSVVSPLSRGEVRQFGRAHKTGDFTSMDGSVVYREALGDVAVPMLFLAGRADRIAPADSVWSYYDAVGSDDKRFVVLSETNGFSGDYGHLDPGVGDRAQHEVYPLISDWLEAHD